MSLSQGDMHAVTKSVVPAACRYRYAVPEEVTMCTRTIGPTICPSSGSIRSAGEGDGKGGGRGGAAGAGRAGNVVEATTTLSTSDHGRRSAPPLGKTNVT